LLDALVERLIAEVKILPRRGDWRVRSRPMMLQIQQPIGNS
jgi:hypothetical protein